MLIYMAGLMMVMIALCGLLLDIGTFEMTKVRMQQAADAAASGAAFALSDGIPMAAGGLADAQANGFTDGQNGVIVILTNPPTAGAYVGVDSAVQATITSPAKSIFLPSNYTMTARATAFVMRTPCVYLLSQSTAQLTLQAANQTFSGSCPFYIGNSFNYTGNTGPQFYVAGPASGSSGTVTNPPPVFGASIVSDPLSYLAEPAFGTCQYFNTNVTKAAVLLPGTYCGGLNVTTNQNVTLNPGVYIIAGNLTIDGPNLSAAGVTLYMTQGGGYSSGTAMLENINGSLSAPTTGPTQGIFFFSDRSLTPNQAMLSVRYWNPSATLDGILYLPNQALSANAGLRSRNYMGIVAAYAVMHNTGFHNNGDFSSLAGGNPFHPVIGSGALVE